MKLILQDSNIGRAKFFGECLAELGKPLTKGPDLRQVTFEGKQLFPDAQPDPKFDPFRHGFSTARCWAEGCLGWIWCQWLSSTPSEVVRKEVEFVVARGIQMQKQCANQDYRCLHDLWLLHCAILGSGRTQLLELAELCVDSKGGKRVPADNGELHAAAWCGMLKHWILGDVSKAKNEFEVVTNSHCHDISRPAPLSLVKAFLSADWKEFSKLQKRDFKSRWDGLRKHGIVRSESKDETVIAFDRIGVPGRGWMWSHCALAKLAHRQGIQVQTDPFWFPTGALECVL